MCKAKPKNIRFELWCCCWKMFFLRILYIYIWFINEWKHNGHVWLYIYIYYMVLPSLLLLFVKVFLSFTDPLPSMELCMSTNTFILIVVYMKCAHIRMCANNVTFCCQWVEARQTKRKRLRERENKMNFQNENEEEEAAATRNPIENVYVVKRKKQIFHFNIQYWSRPLFFFFFNKFFLYSFVARVCVFAADCSHCIVFQSV